MADYPSGLPVRTEADGDDERVHIKIVDYTDPDTAGKQAEVSESNLHVFVDGEYVAEINPNPSTTGVVGMVRDATPADSQQTNRITSVANEDGDVRSLDVSLHDSDGKAITVLNPIPVNIVNNVAGTPKTPYYPFEALTKNEEDTATYTITSGKTFVLQKVFVSGSGKLKAIVKAGTISAEDILCVLYNSTATPNAEYVFQNPQHYTDAEAVKVLVKNLDQEQDIHVTIEGYEF